MVKNFKPREKEKLMNIAFINENDKSNLLDAMGWQVLVKFIIEID